MTEESFATKTADPGFTYNNLQNTFMELCGSGPGNVQPGPAWLIYCP